MNWNAYMRKTQTRAKKKRVSGYCLLIQLPHFSPLLSLFFSVGISFFRLQEFFLDAFGGPRVDRRERKFNIKEQREREVRGSIAQALKESVAMDELSQSQHV